mgnify:CR=1 FL=1
MPYFTIGIGLGRNILHKGGDMDYFYQTLALNGGSGHPPTRSCTSATR